MFRINKNKVSMKVNDKVFDWKREIYEERYNLLLSLLFLILGVSLTVAAGSYVEKKSGVVASDLILDTIPSLDLSFLFVYGLIIIFAVLLIYPLFFNFKKMPYTIFQFSVLIIVRSIFITLTHLKTPFGAVITPFPWPFSLVTFTNDLFFSGHTAIPLVGYFAFRDSKIKWFFLIASFVMAGTVLAMHLHYSIDVGAAFFIAYGCYKLGDHLFKRIHKFEIAHASLKI